MNILDIWPENMFKQKLRMNPSAFHSIVGMISQHFVFSNNSHNDQVSIQLQFAVARYRFGRSGNGASPADVFHSIAGMISIIRNELSICWQYAGSKLEVQDSHFDSHVVAVKSHPPH